MDNLPVESNTVADLVVKAGSFLGWLIVPGLMKYRHLREAKAHVDIDVEVENYRIASQRDADLLARFEGISPESSTPVERAVSSFLADVQSSQHNREKIGQLTSLELEASATPPPEENPLNKDFMTRFYRYAADVSTDEAQKIWAKLLAGEIQKPGSFSLKTLDVLRNLTQKQANAIKTIAPYLVGPGILREWTTINGIGPDLLKFTLSYSPRRDGIDKDIEKIQLAMLDLMPDGFIMDGKAFVVQSCQCDNPNEIALLELANCIIEISHIESFCFTYQCIMVSSEIKELISLDKSIKPDSYILAEILHELRKNNFQVKVLPSECETNLPRIPYQRSSPVVHVVKPKRIYTLPR